MMMYCFWPDHERPSTGSISMMVVTLHKIVVCAVVCVAIRHANSAHAGAGARTDEAVRAIMPTMRCIWMDMAPYTP